MTPDVHLWNLLELARERFGACPAIRQDGRSVDYAALERRCTALAEGLIALGLTPGQRIGILAPNDPAFLEAYFAAAGADLVLCPLNTRLTPLELGAILRDGEARALIAHSAHADLARATLPLVPQVQDLCWIDGLPRSGDPASQVRELDWQKMASQPARARLAPRAGADDVAQLYYTSGTTGEPKGVMLTHRNVELHARNAALELGLSATDVWGHFAPMFHLADAWATFAITLVGGCHVFAPRFDEALVLDVIERQGVTLTNLVPTMLQRLVHYPRVAERDFSRLRLILSGGAPIARDVVRQIMRVFGCTYVQTYGMTETSPYLTLSLLHPHLERLPPQEQFAYRAKTGRPFRGVDLRVVDEQGRDVARDGRQVGEIWVSGATVTPGYWKRPDLTAAAFSGKFLRTGDLATIDGEGYVDIVDRKKDMIITGGEKVYSTEVESALFAHPDVVEAAAFAAPNAEWGEEVRAAVALRAGASVGVPELLAHCRTRLAGFKCPRRIELLDTLPKTGTGKVSKSMLRASFGGA